MKHKQRFIGLLFTLILPLLSGLALGQETSREVDSTTVYFHLETDSAFFNVNSTTFYKVFDGDSLKLSSWNHYTELSLPFHPPKIELLQLEDQNRIDLYYNEDIIYDAKTIHNNWSISYLSGVNFLFSTDDDTQIFFEDSLMAKGFVAVNSPAETIRLKMVQPGKTQYRTFTNATNTFTYRNFYLKPTREKAITYTFVPGLSQFYKRQRIKAMVLVTGFVGFTSLSLANHLNYVDARNEYKDLGILYVDELNQEEALRLGDMLNPAKKKMEDAQKSRTRSIIGLCTVYAINLADGLFVKPKHGYRKERTLELDFEQVETLNMLKVRYNL